MTYRKGKKYFEEEEENELDDLQEEEKVTEEVTQRNEEEEEEVIQRIEEVNTLEDTRKILDILKIISNPKNNIELNFSPKSNDYMIKNHINELEITMRRYCEIENIIKNNSSNISSEELEELKKEKQKYTERFRSNINKLEFSVDIYRIKYDFLFNESNIIMLDTSTNNILFTDYNNDNIRSFIIDNIGTPENSNIFIKNDFFYKENLSIANMILKYSNGLDYLLNNEEIVNRIPSSKFLEALCEAGNIKSFELFKRYFYDDKIEKTKFMFKAACYGGNHDIIQLFIELGFQPDIDTLQKVCFGFGNIEIVKWILKDYLKNFFQIDCSNYSLHNIIINVFSITKDPEIGLFFIEEFKKTGVININQLLFKTIFFENIEIIQLLLLQENIDINYEDAIGQTPIFYTIRCCWYQSNSKIIKLLLLQPNIKLDITTKSKHNLLNHAVLNGQKEAIQLLFSQQQQYIDPNIEDMYGKTPLINAIEHDDIEIVRLLLSHPNIDMNVQNSKGFTALHYTIKLGKLEIIQLLLDQPNINVNIKDMHGKTPLINVIENYDIEIIQLLLIQLLLSHPNIDMNVQNNSNGFTALHYAVFNKKPKIVRLLLEQSNINPNIKDSMGMTPIGCAIHKDDINIVKLLLLHKDTKIDVIKNIALFGLAIEEEKKELIEIILKKELENINNLKVYNIEEANKRIKEIKDMLCAKRECLSSRKNYYSKKYYKNVTKAIDYFEKRIDQPDKSSCSIC